MALSEKEINDVTQQLSSEFLTNIYSNLNNNYDLNDKITIMLCSITLSLAKVISFLSTIRMLEDNKFTFDSLTEDLLSDIVRNVKILLIENKDKIENIESMVKNSNTNLN